jgi:DNA polymerase-3 subunit delta
MSRKTAEPKAKKESAKKPPDKKRDIGADGGKIFILWGDDKFLLNKKVKTFFDSVSDFREFNFNEVSDISDGLTTALEAPFGSLNRVVIISQTIKADDIELFERYLPIPKTSTLVIVCDSKPDERTKVIKLLKTQGEIIGYEIIPSWKEDDIRRHILKVSQHLEIKISSDGIDALMAVTGSDTYRIVSELEKLFIYKGGERIEKADAMEMLPDISGNIFKCISAIAAGEKQKALILIDALFQANEHPLKLHAAMVSTIRTWLFVKELMGKTDNTSIATEAGIGNPQRVYFLSQEVKNIKLEWIVRCLIGLSDLEFKLKRGGGELDFKVFISEMSQ